MGSLTTALGSLLDERGWATNEAAIQREFQRSLCDALGYEPHVVIREAPNGRNWTDLRLEVDDAAIEIKYARQHRSGNHAGTKRYGPVLDDLNKLVSCTRAAVRVMVLVTEPSLIKYSAGRGGSLLPLDLGSERIVTKHDLLPLASSVQRRAECRGAWPDMTLELAFRDQIGRWEILAWVVRPLAQDTTTTLCA